MSSPFSSKPDGYASIFDERGSLYDRAMRQFPEARTQEFQLVIESAKVSGEHTVVDIPAGGGYLHQHLPTGVNLHAFEVTEGFSQHGTPNSPAKVSALDSLPLQSSSVDRVISLAGLHHERKRGAIYREMARILRPGGRISIADVAVDSAEASFLDGFVGQFNVTGHEGYYLDTLDLTLLRAAGFKNITSTRLPCPWRFASVEDMAAFVHQLFGMSQTSPERVLQGIIEGTGYTEDETGVFFNWSLQVLSAHVEPVPQ